MKVGNICIALGLLFIPRNNRRGIKSPNTTMKSVIKIPIIILLLLPLTTAAQLNLNFGLNSGFNRTQVLDNGLKTDPRFRGQPTYNWAPIGLSFGFDLHNNFSMQFEALIAHEGQLFNFVDIDDKKLGEREIDLSYYNFPVLFRFGLGGKKVRSYFSIGPEVSLMKAGMETLFYQSGTVQIPDGVEPPPGAVQNEDGTYLLPMLDLTTLASEDAFEPDQLLRNTDIRVLGDLSLHIQASPKVYISTDIRGSYGFLDLRGDELKESIQNGTATLDDLLKRRANLSIGLWVGVNYRINLDPASLFRKKAPVDGQNVPESSPLNKLQRNENTEINTKL